MRGSGGLVMGLRTEKNMGTGRMRHGELEAINAKKQVKTALPLM